MEEKEIKKRFKTYAREMIACRLPQGRQGDPPGFGPRRHRPGRIGPPFPILKAITIQTRIPLSRPPARSSPMPRRTAFGPKIVPRHFADIDFRRWLCEHRGRIGQRHPIRRHSVSFSRHRSSLSKAVNYGIGRSGCACDASPMLRKASGEIDIGEWRGTIFGQRPMRLA